MTQSDMTFDLNRYLEELEFLVNIDSGSHDCEGVARVAAFFTQEFEKLGWKVTPREMGEGLAPSLEIVSPDGAAPFDILLMGHMDTVFPKGTAAARPFHIKEGRAFGPGVMDMKSGDLFALHLARAYHAAGIRPPSICFLLNSHEEIGSRQARPWIEGLAENSRCALVLEPARANGDLVNARKGSARYTLRFTGKAAHSGVDPQNGASAINELAHWTLALHGLTDFAAGLNLNIGVVQGGASVNAIAESAQAELDVRFDTVEQARRVQAKLDEMRAAPFTQGVSIRVEGGETRPPMGVSPEASAIAATIDQAAQALGVKIGWQKTGGGSDGNFSAARGVPTIDGMGPIGGRAHSSEEYLEVASLSERFALLAETIRRLT